MAEGEVPGDYIIKRQDLHDVCFLVGSEKQEKISTIKSFLVNFSLAFRSMLLETDMKEKNSNDPIQIPNHEPDVFKLMLRYVYGKQNLEFVDVDQAMRFHLLVDQYLMTKLKALSSSYLKENCKNIVQVLMCLVILDMKEFRFKAMTMLHIQFLESEDFKFLDGRIVEFILKLNHSDIPEIYLWRALLSWAEYNCENSTNQEGSNGELEEPAAKKQCIREDGIEVDTQKARGTSLRETLGSMLTYVRFLAMSQKEFAEEVVVTSILTDDEVIQVFLSFATGKPHSLEFISAEMKRLPFRYFLRFTIDSKHSKYDYICHHTIEVHDRNLMLCGIQLRDKIPGISIKLMHNNAEIKVMNKVVQHDSPTVIYKYILKAHSTYDLILTQENDEYDSMELWRCSAKSSNDFCTVSVDSSCIEHLIFCIMD
uniref:BTB domain-containing protein n=1 Tax=Cuerna arida TaxID=1464854 RepID=A0A1B6FGW2_9HEMI